MENKYVLFNVWVEPFNQALIWYCYSGDLIGEARESDWYPIYDNDPRFVVLKSLGDLLEKDEVVSNKGRNRYVITTEEYEAIIGVAE